MRQTTLPAAIAIGQDLAGCNPFSNLTAQRAILIAFTEETAKWLICCAAADLVQVWMLLWVAMERISVVLRFTHKQWNKLMHALMGNGSRENSKKNSGPVANTFEETWKKMKPEVEELVELHVEFQIQQKFKTLEKPAEGNPLRSPFLMQMMERIGAVENAVKSVEKTGDQVASRLSASEDCGQLLSAELDNISDGLNARMVKMEKLLDVQIQQSVVDELRTKDAEIAQQLAAAVERIDAQLLHTKPRQEPACQQAPDRMERAILGLRSDIAKMWRDAPRPSAGTNPKALFIGNIHLDATAEMLTEHFARNSLREVILLKDKVTGLSKGCAFAFFNDEAEVKALLTETDNEFHGRRLRFEAKRRCTYTHRRSREA